MNRSLAARVLMAAADIFDKTALGLGVLLVVWYAYSHQWLLAGYLLGLLVFVYGGLKWLLWRLERARSEPPDPPT